MVSLAVQAVQPATNTFSQSLQLFVRHIASQTPEHSQALPRRGAFNERQQVLRLYFAGFRDYVEHQPIYLREEGGESAKVF
jgi:hypothetical protein